MVEYDDLDNYESKWFSINGDLDDFIFYENEEDFISER